LRFTRIKRLALLGMMIAAIGAQAAAPHFAVVGDRFELDGKPYVIRAGEMHYARIPRAFWRERLQQVRAMGLNTVTTYVFWNLHEPEPGRFDFSGNLDLAAFIRTAQEVGLNVVLRPGPYVSRPARAQHGPALPRCDGALLQTRGAGSGAAAVFTRRPDPDDTGGK
jgi:beta-galactosidase